VDLNCPHILRHVLLTMKVTDTLCCVYYYLLYIRAFFLLVPYTNAMSTLEFVKIMWYIMLLIDSWMLRVFQPCMSWNWNLYWWETTNWLTQKIAFNFKDGNDSFTTYWDWRVPPQKHSQPFSIILYKCQEKLLTSQDLL
jgi:hypothetical protein